MSYKNINPDISEIKTGTPAIKIGDKYVVGGIGGNFIPQVEIKETDVTLGQVDADGKFQPLAFSGTVASNSGSPEVVENYYGFNGVLPVPESGSSSAGCDYYKCASVDTDNKTWTGYKAVLSDGVYSFEETATTGLTYGTAFIPKKGTVYNADATVIISGLYDGTDPYCILKVDFQNSNITPYMGTISFDGSYTATSNGVHLAGGYIKTDTLLEDIADEFTIMTKVTLNDTSRTALFAAHDADGRIGIDSIGDVWSIWAGNSGWNILEADSSYSGDETDGIGRSQSSVIYGEEQTVVYTHSGTNWDLYVDGVSALHKVRSGRIATGGTLSFNRWGTGSFVSNDIVFREIQVYTRALSAEEVAAL